jgi:hypothetical protein
MGTGVTSCRVENLACNFITKFALLHGFGSIWSIIYFAAGNGESTFPLGKVGKEFI